MMYSKIRFVVLFATLAHTVRALQVTPGSSCATFCSDYDNADAFNPDSSTTNTSDITCKDIGFTTTDTGIKFKSCLDCLQKSEKVNGTESDLKWYLYNLRYTISACLFSIPSVVKDADVDSPCVIDYACGPLKAPLTADKMKADPGSTYGYCTASNDTFMGNHLNPCISCLQSSGNQVFLSNFVIALEAGCNQDPKDGDLLGLSGTVFSKNAVNVTAPSENIIDKPEGAGSSTMTTGTIVGIAVGVGLFILGGIALFIVYWRRQKSEDRRQKAYQIESQSTTPDPFLPSDGAKMSQPMNSYRDHPHNDKAPSYMSTGEYYDKLEEDIRPGRINYAFDPRASSHGPNSAIPTHEAYLPRAVSRTDVRGGSGLNGRKPSPPAPVHRHTKSNTPDSFALRTYLSAVDETPHPSIQLPPQTRLSVSPERRPIATPQIAPPPPPPPSKRNKIPSLSLPFGPKLRIPKQYTPPSVTIQGPTPVDENRGREMQISDPVMTNDPRFQDKPLAGGVVYAKQRPASQLAHNKPEYTEVPMRSGKSSLYGF
ncbi:hypothetical protein G7046_g2841 [Stylonectria norvegica]|nr:hypothetical protein G7046_g2841 [Stylonectria norvegica]